MNFRQKLGLIWVVIGFIGLWYAPGPILKLLDVIIMLALILGFGPGIGRTKPPQPRNTALEQAYRILGSHPADPVERITRKYHDLVFISHPDRLPPNSPKTRIQEAHRLLEDYNRAYELVMKLRQKKMT